MAIAISKYGIMYKKIKTYDGNSVPVIVTVDKDGTSMYQTPMHLLESRKDLKPLYVDKNSQAARDYAREHGYSFANSTDDLEDKQ